MSKNSMSKNRRTFEPEGTNPQREQGKKARNVTGRGEFAECDSNLLCKSPLLHRVLSRVRHLHVLSRNVFHGTLQHRHLSATTQKPSTLDLLQSSSDIEHIFWGLFLTWPIHFPAIHRHIDPSRSLWTLSRSNTSEGDIVCLSMFVHHPRKFPVTHLTLNSICEGAGGVGEGSGCRLGGGMSWSQ